MGRKPHHPRNRRKFLDGGRTPVLTASDYIQDGLIFQLDGIEFGGELGYWKNLKGTRKFNLTSRPYNGKGFYFDSSTNIDSFPSVSTIPADYQNQQIETVLIGEKGACFVQRNDKLSIIDTGVRICVRTLYQDTTSLNATINHTDALNKTISANIIDCVINGKKSTIDKHSNFSIPTGVTIGNIASLNPSPHYVNAVRVYNRQLTDDEILYNQRVDNIRFNLGLDLNGGIQPYTPGRALTMSRDLSLDEASPLESSDESLSTEEEECVNVTER